MNKIDELVDILKRNEREEEKCKNVIVWVLAILGAVAAVAGIAYAVYRIIWKTLKMILTTISTIILTTKTEKRTASNCRGQAKRVRQRMF